MSNRLHSRVLGMVALLVLLANAVLTTPAFADGGTPSPSSTGTSTTSSTQLPAGTSVVVLDGQGHKVPLGTQKAAQIEQTGDPVWCPTSVTLPLNGSGGCSPSGTSLAAVITWLNANDPAVNGTIWIEGSYSVASGDSGATSFSLDGSTLSLANAAAHDLTIKGGWNGLGTNTLTGTTTISGASLSITNWHGNLFLNNLIISGAGINGLTVTTTKNITLTKFQANTNTGYGASLDNCRWNGSVCTGTGNVAVTSGLFNGNSGTGLSVLSSGTITVANAIALNNTGGDGMDLDNCKSTGTSCQITTAKAIAVTGDALYNATASAFDNSFNGNNGYGVSVISDGSVTLKDLTANTNTVYGTRVDNSGSSVAPFVTLTGVNVFNGNTSTGLNVVSKGTITASHIIANSNSGSGNQDGALLDNSNAATPLNVTISGSSQFNSNGQAGLVVNTRGAITLYGVTANFNKNGNGVYLTNDFNPAVHSAVTIGGTNFFNNNYDSLNFVNTGGLVIYSYGSVKLNNVTADSNTGLNAGYNGWGVLVQNQGASTPQTVTLTGVNTFNNNAGFGLQVYSSGAVSAASVNANTNAYTGAYFSAGALTLTTANLANNGSTGLYVLSNSTVSASNLSVTGNSSDGADIIQATNVTLSGSNLFDSNKYNGFSVTVTGNISLNNLTATNNGLIGTSGVGVNISGAAVKITGTNIFNGNYSGGLDVNSTGAITVNALTASNNSHGFGVQLNNTTSLMPGVTLTGANTFNNNNSYGLTVNTYGTISASSLTAIGNVTGDGVDLYNFANPTPTAKTVTVSGFNTFGDNGVNGLAIASLGAITAGNITAYVSPSGTSTGYSVGFSNAITGAVGGVTLTGTNVFNDYQTTPTNQDGLLIDSNGAVSLNNVTANGNGTAGVSVDNSTASLPQIVKLTGSNTFNSNHGTGLSIKSIGAITVYNLAASNTATGDGADLNTSTGGSTATVTLIGASLFQGNYINGLYIQSSGAVVTNGITASQNGLVGLNGDGVLIDNTSASAPQNVSLLGTTNVFNNNYGVGLYVKSKGAITAAYVSANNDVNGNGVTLDNSGTGASGGVSLTGANTFYGNHADGLQVISKGAITANSLDAEWNHSDGVSLDNSAGSSVNVSLTGMNLFENNSSIGLYINSSGALSLSKVYSDNNTGDGLNVASATNISVTCGGFTGNGADGINANTPGTLSLSGVVSFGNTGTQIALMGGGTLVNTVRDCPLP